MRAIVLVCAAAALLLPGCARYQQVAIRSQPPDAEVFLDKQLIGRTPLELRIDRDQPHAVYVKRSGYRPELVVLERVQAPDGLPFLVPPDVEVRLVPAADASDQERDLEIEAEPPPR